MIKHVETLEHARFGEVHRLEWELGDQTVDVALAVNRQDGMAILWISEEEGHWAVDPDCGVPADWWSLRVQGLEGFFRLAALYDRENEALAVVAMPMDQEVAILAVEVDAFLQGLLAPRVRWRLRDGEPVGT